MNQPASSQDPESVDAQLERLLAEAENTVSVLRRELHHARSRREREIAEAEQHAEIERLQEHLAKAQVHWGEVRAFFETALAELRPLQDGAPDERSVPDGQERSG